MLIRRETPPDLDAIDLVHRSAFEPPAPGVEPVEVGLAAARRGDAAWVPALSLVAEDPGGEVVGHVVCTVGSLGPWSAVGLGPIGVRPDRQADGFGSALMHAVLGAADALDHAVVVLLGHLDYYPRFGFVPARSIGIEPPDASWAEHFQEARALGAWNPAVSGTFRYAAPFDSL